MATIFVYPDADIGVVEATLNRFAQRQHDQWLVEPGPLFVMLFDSRRFTPEDGFGQAEIDRISAARGAPLTCAVYVEIAGGAGEAAKSFVAQVLAACGGWAEDEASGHLWTLAEISAGATVGHLRFYDARRYGEYRVPFAVPAEHVRYVAVTDADDIVRGYRDGWLTGEDATRLAFLRRRDMTDRGPDFGRLEALTPGTAAYDELAATIADRYTTSAGFWAYVAVTWCYTLERGERGRNLRLLAEATGSPDLVDVAADPDRYGLTWLAVSREHHLLDRVAAGDGMNWLDSSALMGTDRPEEVDAAFDRGERDVGVAVIGFALTHPDPWQILPRTALALASTDTDVRAQGIIALAHVARLHGVVDRANLDLLRTMRRGNAADDDLWTFVPHRLLPWWLRRYQLVQAWRWRLWDRWFS